MAGGARERTAGDREDSGLMQAFLAGVGGDLLRGGTGGGGGQPGLPRPAGACRARRHDDRLGVLPPAGDAAAQSIQAVRLALRGRTGSG